MFGFLKNSSKLGRAVRREMFRENMRDFESFKSDGLNIYMAGKEFSRSREDEAGGANMV